MRTSIFLEVHAFHIRSIVRTCDLGPEIAHLKCALYSGKYGNSSCSPLLQQLFTLTAGETVPEDQRTTRGQVSNLLQVPFFRGPGGRSIMMFRGIILWNALPSDFRVIGVPGPFRKALSAIDILNL